MFSSLFAAVKDIFGQINRIDNSIYTYGRNFADVYERNIALEEEIKQRTEELEQANKTILSLNSVWEMMNSAQPLSNMLDKIISILNEDMDYRYAAILKLEEKENGEKYFEVKADSNNEHINNARQAAFGSAENTELPYVPDSPIAKAAAEKQIYSAGSIKEIIKLFFPPLNDEQLYDTERGLQSKNCIIVPLHNKKDVFGCVIVFSDRESVSDTEKNFLSLYANQAELAITAAGLFEEVKKQAVTDPLTGLYNRRYFEENLIKEAERSIRLKQPFSLISLDLDFLKKINDKYGHQYGDLAIKTIANVLKKEARSIDTPARIGGEEFNVLLPGVNSQGAGIAAERIRKSIENQVIDTIGGVTASIGAASFLEHTDRIDELVKMADQAMYKAKLSGRNQVKIAQPKSGEGWMQAAADAFLDIIANKLIPLEEETSKKLIDILSNTDSRKETAEENLFAIADELSRMYNKMNKAGSAKDKQHLAEMLAEKLELPKEEIDRLKTAVLLYDIGNMLIPEYIFEKKEPLTDVEKEMIKQHPVIAAREILKPISQIQDIIPIIENHHENWDGSGYPGHKQGLEIPVSSQIVLLTDAFYAMLQDRPYRNAYTLDEIIKIIKQDAGKRWNEKLAEAFLEIINSSGAG